MTARQSGQMSDHKERTGKQRTNDKRKRDSKEEFRTLPENTRKSYIFNDYRVLHVYLLILLYVLLDVALSEILFIATISYECTTTSSLCTRHSVQSMAINVLKDAPMKLCESQ